MEGWNQGRKKEGAKERKREKRKGRVRKEGRKEERVDEIKKYRATHHSLAEGFCFRC
jgi:hypothetical protein